MTKHPAPRKLLLVALAAWFSACGSGSVDNKAPRIGAVPLQSTTGDASFTLDLATFVTDGEGDALTYAVSSGGGAFTGSVYTNRFDTMGDHVVAFTVGDGQKTTAGSFVVRVTKGNFAVVGEDQSGLLLLDTRTNAFVRVAGAASGPTLAAGLPDGRLIYELTGSNGQQVWSFDPLSRRSGRILPALTTSTVYRATLPDGRIVVSSGSGNDQRLYVHSPTTGLTRDVAQGLLAGNTVVVDDDGLLFYEVGVDGQPDVYAYDPASDEIFAVGTAPTAERIKSTMPGGGVLFSRLGTAGEPDLFCYRVSAGLVEVGADLPALDLRAKAFAVCGTAGQVVFAANNSGSDELFVWNPANGQTTPIATGGHYVYDGLGAGNEVVYRQIVSGSEQHLRFQDLDTGLDVVLDSGANLKQVLGISGDGTTAWVFLVTSAAPNDVRAMSLVGTPATATWSAGGPAALAIGVLRNGDVVAQRNDGARLNVFVVAGGAWGTQITGAGLAFAGDGLGDGDFVYQLEVSGQTDLSMWNAAISSPVAVSAAPGDDVFQLRTVDGTLLFTRVLSGNTNADLFVWDGAQETRLTDIDDTGLRRDHAVLGSYNGSR